MEFALIDRIRRRAAARGDVVLGIGDDAALLRPAAGCELVATCDTLNAGVHFPSETVPFDLGWKTLAVSLSDLAAMGAEPAWCLLSLSLPQPDAAWLDAFLDGLLELAVDHGIALVGGDTTHGPLSIALTALGQVPAGAALRRDGACVGDDIWVTGVPGEAAQALAQWRSGVPVDATLRARLDRPTPRVAAGLALRGLATACIDVSDGLSADLGHVLRASGVGATLALEALPCSAALALLGRDERRALQAGGGDDYELCFTAPPARRADVLSRLAACTTPVSRIGVVVAGDAPRWVDAEGRTWCPPRAGWQHFLESPA
jgi:thiamine-monophosphate kinase